MDLASWWTTCAAREVRHELRGDARWAGTLAHRAHVPGLHLAVFVEPFLSHVLSGRKSIESRFSTRQCAPFRRVNAGDVLLLKAASGPVVGICQVAKAWYFDLKSMPLGTLRERYAEAICATDDDFWIARERAEYATLLKLRDVRALPPLLCPKRDRRGWVVLRGDQPQLQLANTE